VVVLSVWIWIVAHWPEILIAGAIIGGVSKGVQIIGKFLFKLNAKLDYLTQCNDERAEDFPLLFKGLWACLDGLHQTGANGPVTDARKELQEHLFKRTGREV
jgi:hypothetical protein